MKNYEKALEELSIASEHHPTHTRIYNNIGVAYAEMKKYDSAAKYFQKSLVFAPKFPLATKNLAIDSFYPSFSDSDEIS